MQQFLPRAERKGPRLRSNVTSVADRTKTACRAWLKISRNNNSTPTQLGSIVLLFIGTPTDVSSGDLMNQSLPHQLGGWWVTLYGFPISDKYGSWSEPKLPLLSIDTPTIIPGPYLVPVGPALSCSAQTDKSSWARSVNSGKCWMCHPNISCYTVLRVSAHTCICERVISPERHPL